MTTHNRWLVIWYDGNDTQASLVDDDATDIKFPFGVTPDMIDPACCDITAIVEVGDMRRIPVVAIDDREYKLADPDEQQSGCDTVEINMTDIESVIADNKDSDVTVSPSWDRVRKLLVEHLGVEAEAVTPTINIVGTASDEAPRPTSAPTHSMPSN
jgi:hypothetical protein